MPLLQKQHGHSQQNRAEVKHCSSESKQMWAKIAMKPMRFYDFTETFAVGD